MDRRTISAIILMMVIAFLPTLFIKKPAPKVGATVDSTVAPSAAPVPAPVAAPDPASPAQVATGPVDTIRVTTPLARYGVSTQGGALVRLELAEYASQVKGGTGGPVDLVRAGEPLLGLTVIRGADTVRLDRWTLAADQASVEAGSAPASLTLSGQGNDLGVQLTYTFAPDDYQVGVRGQVTGLGVDGGQVELTLGAGLPNTEADSVENFRNLALVTHRTQADRHDFGSLDPGQPQVHAGPFDWVAVKSKYFVAGVLAFDTTGGRIAAATLSPAPDAGKRPTRAPVTLRLPVPASGAFAYTLYAGPMEYDRLGRLGHDFDDVNPYGWPGFRTLIRFFAVPVRAIMVWMHESLRLHYGVVLILFGLLVRVLLWPLNQKAMRASTAMQAVQPQLQALQERYKSDPQKLQQEMFKLYKEHNVNPLGGCWPMLLPMPILFALFFVLGNTIELRGVPFLWFPDLARADPLYIIPVLSGISMFALSKVGQMGIQHTPQTKAQAQMMLYMMPAMITFFGFQFASGLNLYWTVSNIASIPQQWLIGKERMKGMARQIVEVRTKPDATVTRTKPRK